MNKPEISVVIPLYNREEYIVETLNSILKQNFYDFELILINDGSTDRSEEIVKPFLKDKRVKYIYHKNIGEVETVNKGWALANGKYFTQINSDDPILPGLFTEMVKAMNQNPKMLVAYSDFNIIDKNGKLVNKIKNSEWDFKNALTTFSCFAAAPGAFIRRSAFKDLVKLKDKRFRYISDVKMYWNMSLRGPFLYIPQTLSTWRSHGKGISNERYKSIPEIEILFHEFFSKPDIPKEIFKYKNLTRLAICRYIISLAENSNPVDKVQILNTYQETKDYLEQIQTLEDNYLKEKKELDNLIEDNLKLNKEYTSLYESESVNLIRNLKKHPLIYKTSKSIYSLLKNSSKLFSKK